MMVYQVPTPCFPKKTQDMDSIKKSDFKPILMGHDTAYELDWKIPFDLRGTWAANLSLHFA